MLRALLTLVAATVFLACLLAPPLYEIIRYLYGSDIWPYSRVFDRVVMLFAFVFILVLRRKFPLADVRECFARGSWAARGRAIAGGAAVSLLSVGLIFAAVVRSRGLIWHDYSISDYFVKFCFVLPAALVVSLIEEASFRALLVFGLLRSYSAGCAVTLSSLLYAAVHFLSPVKSFAYEHYSPEVGFAYLGAVFERLLLPGILPGMFGLFLVGVTLSVSLICTRSIYLCVGLHLGWVAAMKLALWCTDPPAGAALPGGLGGRYFLVAEPLVWASVVLVLASMVVLSRRSGIKHSS